MFYPTELPALETTDLDLALVRKYAVPGPRYTSYPPATRFSDDLAALDVGKALADDNAPAGRATPLSLYVHVPFCASRCWYCGCNTIITRHAEMADRYLDDLEREIELTVRQIDPERRVEQLHLGGGTPTFLSPSQLVRLHQMLRMSFVFSGEAEISVEIDPRTLTPGHRHALAMMGVNRASLGVQDTQLAVQQAIHRVQPQEMNRRAVEALRSIGVRSINLDLIYGLPRQTVATLEATLDDVAALAPDRLSVFSYAHVPWVKPAQRIFDQRGQLPSPEEKLAQFAALRRRLLAAGYEDIGLDHFARPGDELAKARRAGSLHRNFQGYSTHAGASLYGFGLSAISQTRDTYRQNVKTLAAYREALSAGRLPVERGYRLSPEDHRRRRLVMDIMCQRRLDFARLRTEAGIDVPADYAPELASMGELENDGLVRVTSTGVEVLPKGEPLLRVIAMRFDAASAPGAKRHALAV